MWDAVCFFGFYLICNLVLHAGDSGKQNIRATETDSLHNDKQEIQCPYGTIVYSIRGAES